MPVLSRRVSTPVTGRGQRVVQTQRGQTPSVPTQETTDIEQVVPTQRAADQWTRD